MPSEPCEVPFEELQRSARAFIEIFHVSVVGITSQDEKVYVGGGTLVTINGVPGVLTADHVWQAVLDGRYIQVAFGGTGTFVAPGIPVSDVRVVHRVSPVVPDDGFGPDLAFIWIPEPYMFGLCDEGKRVFNLSGSREPAMTARRTAKGDPRVIFGVPEETVSTYEDEDHMGPVTRMAIGTPAYFSRIIDTHEVGGWGYVDFSLEGGAENASESMHGMSGFGLWRVGDAGPSRVLASQDTTFLDGIVQRWTERPPFIRCHDRSSLYKFVDEVVPKLASYPEFSGYA